MALELYSKQFLVYAALMTKRPVAFLVGSPLSQHENSGVPGITTMVDLIRTEIHERLAIALPEFESELTGKTGADAYQAAMKFLGATAGQDAVNDVIAKAVLQARKSIAGACPAGSDGHPEEWNIAAGTTGLAELVTRGGDRFLGPILTTNFDPLISLGIRKFGGRAGRRVLAADGNLAGAAEDDPGICSVIHLHGFWRDSDTLHTQAQLTKPRPKLKASLQRLLVVQRRTLIVAAYGGWDDVFTQALVELVNDEQAQLDVIWCFHESDPDLVEQRYGRLLYAMDSAITLNRFRPFGGIDCHSIFQEILGSLQSTDPPEVIASTATSPIAGWEQIDSKYLDSLPSLSADEVIRYFDGAVPAWPHAISTAIPRRRVGAQLAESLADLASRDDTARSLRLIRAAGGEGKSTLLLQVTADAVRSGAWSVLWRTSSKARISPEQLAGLDPNRKWLIVADDADTLVRDLADSALHLSRTLRRGIHFLMAARDADWRAARGSQNPWAEWLTHFDDIVLRGITREDAEAVVSAWEQFGVGGLRALSHIGDTAERIAAFELAVSNSEERLNDQKRTEQEGSFFGGLLTVRFGQHGLQAHVRDFLHRLKNSPIEHSTSSLFDALLYVAACHGTGIPGIDERVLADLVGVPGEWVQRQVVRPLGEEATVSYSAGQVLTRHTRVAAAILVEAEPTFGVDLAEVWTQLIRGTASTSRRTPNGIKSYSNILNAGPRLHRALPQQISKRRREVIAVAAAKADYEAEPKRLGPVIGLAQTLRLTGDSDAAANLFRQHLDKANSAADAAERLRGYWYEWSVCEGSRGAAREHGLAGTWLGALSISDYLNPVPITAHDGKLTCAGIAVALRKLAQRDAECPYAKALRAIALLGRGFGYDPKSYFFDRHDRAADSLKVPHPQDLSEAIAWLATGVAEAGRQIKDSFLRQFVEPEEVSYLMLRQTIRQYSGPLDIAGPRVQQAPALLTKNILSRLSSPDPLVAAGIERVIVDTWKAIPLDHDPEARFRVAVQRAKQIVSRLSPQIRRAVGAYFETRKWEPLKNRDPESADPVSNA